jgi:hypothetical protein
MPQWVINLIKHHWKTIKGIRLFDKYATEYGMHQDILSTLEIDDIENKLFPNTEAKSKITHIDHQILADESKAKILAELDALREKMSVRNSKVELPK